MGNAESTRLCPGQHFRSEGISTTNPTTDTLLHRERLCRNGKTVNLYQGCKKAPLRAIADATLGPSFARGSPPILVLTPNNPINPDQERPTAKRMGAKTKRSKPAT